jgi:hypothetical protein
MPLNYFSNYPEQFRSRRERFSSMKIWIRDGNRNFSLSIALSLVLHLMLFILFLVSPDFSSSQARSKHVLDSDVFVEALKELQLGSMKDGARVPLPKMSDEELLDAIERSQLPDMKLGKDERAEFYKRLVRAYVLLKEKKQRENLDAEVTLSDVLAYLETLGELELNSGDKVYPFKRSSGEQSLRLFGLAKEKRDKIKKLKQFEDMEKRSANIQRGEVRIETETGIKYIPVEYYFRKSPYEKMLALGPDLFYIVQGFPVLEEGNPVKISLDKGKRIEEYARPRENMVVVLLEESIDQPGFVSRTQPQTAMALEMPEGKRNEILDSLMSLSEEKQLDYFAQNYMEKYDSDGGDLAAFTREFIRKNLSNVIIVIDPISGAFDFMEELYYNKPTDYRFYESWLRSPQSKTATEYLLYLAGHYDFEKRGLAYLVKAYKEAKKILSQRYYKTNVFNKKLKAYIIKEVHDELMFELKMRGYESVEEVFDKYIFEQKRIYNLLIEKGGETKNRGLYMLGCLYWDEADYNAALQTWKKIDRDYSTKILREIRVIMTNFPETDKAISLIDDIFDWQSSRSSKNLLERLLKYDRWQKRSANLPIV